MVNHGGNSSPLPLVHSRLFCCVIFQKKTEAAETVNAVNARYGYKPEFLEIYAQAGAAIASKKNYSAWMRFLSLKYYFIDSFLFWAYT